MRLAARTPRTCVFTLRWLYLHLRRVRGSFLISYSLDNVAWRLKQLFDSRMEPQEKGLVSTLELESSDPNSIRLRIAQRSFTSRFAKSGLAGDDPLDQVSVSVRIVTTEPSGVSLDYAVDARSTAWAFFIFGGFGLALLVCLVLVGPSLDKNAPGAGAVFLIPGLMLLVLAVRIARRVGEAAAHEAGIVSLLRSL